MSQRPYGEECHRDMRGVRADKILARCMEGYDELGTPDIRGVRDHAQHSPEK